MTILNIPKVDYEEENSFVQNRKLEVNLGTSRSREIPVLFWYSRREHGRSARMVNHLNNYDVHYFMVRINNIGLDNG